jgi:hypothetical protein
MKQRVWIISLIVAVFILGVLTMKFGPRLFEQGADVPTHENSSAEKKEGSTKDAQDTSRAAAQGVSDRKPFHVAFVKAMPDGDRLTYDAQDLGHADPYVALAGNHLAFVRTAAGAKPDSEDGHIIYDGVDKGPGTAVAADGDHFAFIRLSADRKANHLIYDDKDLGVIRSGQDIGEGLILRDGHVAFETEVDGKAHILYDGRDMGEGIHPIIGENSLAFLRQVQGGGYRMIYNGKDMGPASPAFPCVTDEHVVFTRPVGADNQRFEVVRNDQVLATSGPGLVLQCSGRDYAFSDDDPNFIFNGRNLGRFNGYGQESAMADGHVAFTRQVDGKTHVIYDGQDIGEGISPAVSGDDVAFVREVQGKKHVFLNGEDKGEIKEGGSPALVHGNLAFFRKVGDVVHVIINGTDSNACDGACLGYERVVLSSGNDSIILR